MERYYSSYNDRTSQYIQLKDRENIMLRELVFDGYGVLIQEEEKVPEMDGLVIFAQQNECSYCH